MPPAWRKVLVRDWPVLLKTLTRLIERAQAMYFHFRPWPSRPWIYKKGWATNQASSRLSTKSSETQWAILASSQWMVNSPNISMPGPTVPVLVPAVKLLRQRFLNMIKMYIWESNRTPAETPQWETWWATRLVLITYQDQLTFRRLLSSAPMATKAVYHSCSLRSSCSSKRHSERLRST